MMGKCFFSKIESEIVTLANYDGVSIHNDTFGEYWISRQACYNIDNGEKLDLVQKNKCLTEVVKLNKKGLIPFWVTTLNPDFHEDGKIVQRTFDEVTSKEINHDEKELGILNLLLTKSEEAGEPFKYTKITKPEQYLLQIYNDNELIDWISSLLEQEYVALTDEGQALFQEIHHEMIRTDFANSITSFDFIKITPKGRKFILSSKDSQPTWNNGQIFWSWQSHDNKSRNEIKTALDFALEVINNSNLLSDPLFIEIAMRPEDGANKIDDNIPRKIKETRFFIGDVTPIKVWKDDSDSRRVLYPNPNICIEVGYALEALEPNQILLISREVENDDFKLAQMPFDISTRPIHKYKDRSKLKTDLVGIIGTSLKVYNEINNNDLITLIEIAKNKVKED